MEEILSTVQSEVFGVWFFNWSCTRILDAGWFCNGLRLVLPEQKIQEIS